MKFEKLSEIVEIIMGQSPPSSSYNLHQQGLPFFQGKADFGDLYPKMRVFCDKPQKIAQAGDILISVRAPVGSTNISPEKSCIGRGLAALRCGKRINGYYLLYFLRFHEPALVQLSNGSTFDAISKDDLENILVPLPPLAEQKRIAAILEKADRLRRLRRYALELSGTYLQSVFLEMFRDAGHRFETVTIEDVASQQKHALSSGPFGSNLTSAHYTHKGVVVLRGLNISGGELDLSDVKYVSEEKARELSRSEIRPDDIVVVAVGSSGLACRIPASLPRAIMSQNFNKVTPDLNKIDPIFLENVINSPLVQKQLHQEITDTVRTFLSLTKLKDVKIPLPPLSLQRKFAQIVQKYERLRSQQREAERQAEHLFQTLLHKAFRGELTGDEMAGMAALHEEVVPRHGQKEARVPEPIEAGVLQMALPLE